MTSATIDIVGEVCQQFSRDGIRVSIRHFDESRDRVDLELDLTGVECLDCVMPRDYMERLIAGSIAEIAGHRMLVSLADPRLAERSAAPVSAPLVMVLDPTGEPAEPAQMDPGPAAGMIRTKTVGFRVDTLWRSWDWVADEWMQMFTDAGAQVRSWRRAQGIHGAEGDALQADFEAFVGSVDVLVSGLGNCGSCTAWTIKAAVAGLTTGLPAVAVVTEQFAPLAGTLAQDVGQGGLRRHILPYPLDTLPESEVRRIARDAFGSLLLTLGAEV
jgi:hypothetical protein